MQWNGLLGSRWLPVAVCMAGVMGACGDKADDDLFQGGGSAGKRGSGGSVMTGGSSSVSSGAGGQGTGGNGVAGAAPSGGSGGSSLSSGGKVSGSGGAVNASGGKQSAAGAGQGGAKPSGGAAVAGASGGVLAVAGSAQGGSSPAEGGAGEPSAGAAGAGGAVSRTIQIGALLDSYVDACNPTSRMGSEETLSVDSDPCAFEIYIKPASLSDIPPHATVESALLELHCVDDFGDVVHVHGVTGEWSEESVDWDNRPSIGEEIGSFTPLQGPVVIDITSLVQGWLAGAPMNGVALTQGPETDGSDYYSVESNQDEAPRLLVTYTQ